jgi:monofunctional biosynthetic peptidoglycan transglycosylase
MSLWILAVLAGLGVSQEPPADRVLFDFDPKAAVWQSVDDRVMGGVSLSKMTIDADGIATFAGTVSLENNGGFCSVRSGAIPGGLKGAGAIKLRLKPDGKTYTVNLRTGERAFGSFAYRARLEGLKAGEWTEVEVPFSRFEPVSFGRRVPNAPALEPSKVTSLSLQVGDKQTGPFALQIDWIRAIPSP